jgi:hypothetical protein
MFAVNHVPIAVLVRLPVGVIPIGIGVDRRAIARMHCGAVVRMDSSPIGPGSVICPVGAVHGRTASGVCRGAVTSLNRFKNVPDLGFSPPILRFLFYPYLLQTI